MIVTVLEKTCRGKVQRSKKDAQTIANCAHRRGVLVTAYHCVFCNCWHVGHYRRAK